MVVDHKPGAGSILGAETAAKSPPDGYTLLMGHIGTHGANPALYARLPYDPVKDFAPVSLLVTIPNLILVPATAPVAVPRVRNCGSAALAGTMAAPSPRPTRDEGERSSGGNS